jgi:hypothetical protein
MEFDHYSYILILVGLASLFASLNVGISRLASIACIVAIVFVQAIYVSNPYFRVTLYVIGGVLLTVLVWFISKREYNARGE